MVIKTNFDDRQMTTKFHIVYIFQIIEHSPQPNLGEACQIHRKRNPCADPTMGLLPIDSILGYPSNWRIARQLIYLQVSLKVCILTWNRDLSTQKAPRGTRIRYFKLHHCLIQHHRQILSHISTTYPSINKCTFTPHWRSPKTSQKRQLEYMCCSQLSTATARKDNSITNWNVILCERWEDWGGVGWGCWGDGIEGIWI